MPYIGRQLTQGNFIKLDDLQSQFDGSKTTFNLTTGGSSYTPGSANALLVSLGGVIQEVGTSFTVSNNQITFSNPPTADAQIFIIALGNSEVDLTSWNNLKKTKNGFFFRHIEASLSGSYITGGGNGFMRFAWSADAEF